MHKTTPGFSLLPIIAILAVVSLAAFIGYKVYDTNTKNNSNSQTSSTTQNTNQSSNSNQDNQQASSTKTYTSEKYGYSFEYPADWDIQTVGGTVTLKAPGTITTDQPIGGYTTDKGAIITLNVSKCADSQTCATPDVYGGQYSSAAKNRSKFTLNNGIQVDRYTFAWESEQALYTLFALNNTLFMSNLTAEGDELTSPYLQDYNDILGSIAFL